MTDTTSAEAFDDTDTTDLRDSLPSAWRWSS